MDIRVSAYNNITTTSFGASAGGPAAVAVQNAAKSGPVEAVRAVNPTSSGLNQPANQAAAPRPTEAQRLDAQADGRGKIIDIYA